MGPGPGHVGVGHVQGPGPGTRLVRAYAVGGAVWFEHERATDGVPAAVRDGRLLRRHLARRQARGRGCDPVHRCSDAVRRWRTLLAVWAARRGGFVRRPAATCRSCSRSARPRSRVTTRYSCTASTRARLGRCDHRPGVAPSFRCSSRGRFSASGSADAGGRLLLAFAGVTAVIQPSGGLDRDRALGALLFVAGAACWGIYSVLGKSATARFGAVTATLYATATGARCSSRSASPSPAGRNSQTEMRAAWVSILYLAVFGDRARLRPLLRRREPDRRLAGDRLRAAGPDLRRPGLVLILGESRSARGRSSAAS